MIGNNRAQQLYEKLGFRKIGIIRDAYFDIRYGKFTDIIYMDLLKKDLDVSKDNILKQFNCLLI
jgi:RimJ/RimL family protein N-acetyltransferase